MDSRTGDILTYEGKYIVQGVNSLGIMGNPSKRTGGLALQIRETYPKVYEVYRRKYQEGLLKLGYSFGVDCGKHTIINIVTQKDIGRWKKPFNYTAFTLALSNIDKSISGPVAFPPIGCGLGGADFNKVVSIIEENCKNIKPIIYYLNDEVPF
tara:strand:- start:556 stop:1014 length:459 start_codon:yes stop_codon:yes gene_type:complete